MLPDDDSSKIFRSEIYHLAAKFNSIPFDPHVTISRLPEKGLNTLISEVHVIGKKMNSFQVEFRKAAYGKNPYQKITIPLKPNVEYFKSCDIIDVVLEGDFSKRTFPHLSLFYGNQSLNTLSEEIKNLNTKTLPPAELKFLALFKLSGLPYNWELVYKTELS